MLDPGSYSAVLLSAVTTETKTGKEQVVITFNVTHVALDGDWSLMPNAVERSMYLPLSDGAWPYTEKKLAALGFTGDFLAPRFSEEVYEKGVTLNCTHSTYEGKEREKWELADWGGVELEPAPEDRLRRLNAKWKAKAANAPTPASKPPASTPAPAPPPAPAATTIPDRPVDRLDVWNHFQSSYAAKTPDERNEIWRKCVDDIAKNIGTPEAEFASEMWATVAIALDPDLPF